jgi:hypothetical protein
MKESAYSNLITVTSDGRTMVDASELLKTRDVQELISKMIDKTRRIPRRSRNKAVPTKG